HKACPTRQVAKRPPESPALHCRLSSQPHPRFACCGRRWLLSLLPVEDALPSPNRYRCFRRLLLLLFLQVCPSISPLELRAFDQIKRSVETLKHKSCQTHQPLFTPLKVKLMVGFLRDTSDNCPRKH